MGAVSKQRDSWTTSGRLKVNQQKRAAAWPWERKFLGFSFTSNREPKPRIAPKAVLLMSYARSRRKVDIIFVIGSKEGHLGRGSTGRDRALPQARRAQAGRVLRGSSRARARQHHQPHVGANPRGHRACPFIARPSYPATLSQRAKLRDHESRRNEKRQPLPNQLPRDRAQCFIC